MMIQIAIEPNHGYFMSKSSAVGLSDEAAEHRVMKDHDKIVCLMSMAAMRLWLMPIEGSC